MTTTELAVGRFPSPFELPVPEACAGWEEMYPYHWPFSEDRREYEESRFWFYDGMHFPEPVYPFDVTVIDACGIGLGQSSSRSFAIPPSLAIDWRVWNGYVYLSPNSITDEETIARRAGEFAKRGGYYYQHWDELYAAWQERVLAVIRELEGIEVPGLGELEDEAVVTSGRGWGASHAILAGWGALLEGLGRMWQYHAELLNLGYAAYLVFYQLVRAAFPAIADQTIARMVSGIDVMVFRPDEELKRLARLAVELGVAEPVRAATGLAELESALRRSEAGERWLAELERAKDPWFNFCYGSGFSHADRSWIDDPTLPIRTIASYVTRLEAGEEIARPLATVLAERDRITAEYRDLLPDEESRGAFDASLALARTVFPYVENHNFYVEHWYHTLFWNKVREFGALLARHGFLPDAEDVFFLQAGEVGAALEELRLSWTRGWSGSPRGPRYWPPLVARRKRIWQALRDWTPPPALGRVPEAIAEPMTIMLWGITTERVESWLAPGAENGSEVLTGFAGSPGVAEGPARVISTVEQLHEIQEGEILVAPVTSNSWTAVFDRIAGAVSDIGGIMSHAAIVSREYGLPAVVGTGVGTSRIKTGDLVRVDGNAGTVTVLSVA